MRPSRLPGELDAIVRQNGVDAAGYGFQQVFEELHAIRLSALSTSWATANLRVAVDADEQVQFAFGGLHLGDSDVKEADGITLEALTLRFVALDIRQAGDAVPLEATMQR